MDFPVSRGLLDSVKQSRQKYQNDLAHKKKMAEQEEVEKRKEVEELRQKAKKIEQKDKMKQCEEEIQQKQICLRVADDAIQSDNKQLQEALTKKKPIVQSILHSASSQIDMGLERKRKLVGEIEILNRHRLEIENSSL